MVMVLDSQKRDCRFDITSDSRQVVHTRASVITHQAV